MSFSTYFRASSYAMIAVATFGLVLAAALHFGLAILFSLLMIFAWFVEGKRWQLSERVGLVLVLLSLPIFYLDWTYQSFPLQVLENGPDHNPLVGAIAHLIVFLSAIKLLQVKADRDWVFLYLISFFEVLLAAGLSFSPVFLVALIMYLVCALSTVIAFEIHKARQTLTRVETRLLVAPDSIVFRRLARHGARGSVEVRRLPAIAFVLLVLICLLALPLFLAAPRGSGGAFARSSRAPGSFVGFSESVTLGEIGTLKQNDEIVMHVRVDGVPDLARDLRWRGIGLDEFTGRGWKKSAESRRSEQPASERGFFKLGTTEALHRLTTQFFYVEPMETTVVFAAPRAVALQGSFPYLRVDGEGSIQSRGHESERVLYKAISDMNQPEAEVLRRDARPYPDSFDRYRRVSGSLDPRIPSLAATVIFNAHALNRYDRAKAIEQQLQRDFGYTLELKAGGSDPLADFLFNVREGHCEYFSTAMAVMLRTQGIATRVVNGFLSGEYNDAAGAYTVRQSDAHSWVEVYFPETKSWVTFDPTPVAGRAQPRHTGLAASLGKYAEAFELIWFQYVVGYDKQEQRSLATSLNNKLFGYRRTLTEVVNQLKRAPQPLLWKAIYLVTLSALIGIGWLLARRVKGLGWRRGLRLTREKEDGGRSPVEFYERLSKSLAERGLERSPNQTPLEFAVAIERSDVLAITNAYNRVRFGGHALRDDEVEAIETCLQELRADLHGSGRS
jgi:transglutaminase-like putative cysteine protease